MIRHIIRSGAAALALVLAGPAALQAQTRLSLQDVQQLAVKNYEAVQLAKSSVEQAQLLRKQAFSAVLPSVNVIGTYTRNLVSAEFDIGNGRTIQILPANDYNFGFNFSQPIYAGKRELRALRQTEANIEAAGVSLGLTVQDTVLTVTRGYYRVIGAEEYVAISKRALDLSQATLRTSESLFRAGETVETAALRSRVAVSSAERQLLEAENALVLAREQLRIFLGIEGPFGVTRPQPPAPPAGGLDDLIKEGLAGRDELRALELQRRIAELEVSKRKGAYLPTVKADGSVTQRRANFPSSRIGSVAINATWNVFNGFRTGAEVASAETTLRETDLRRDLLRKQLENEIRTAFLRIQTFRANVDTLTAQVDVARRNADETGRAYKVGEATDLDILTANELLSRSERDLLEATFSYELAMYDLQRAVGTFAADLAAQAAPGGQS
jgi:protease secretion system outer membrane protein